MESVTPYASYPLNVDLSKLKVGETAELDLVLVGWQPTLVQIHVHLKGKILGVLSRSYCVWKSAPYRVNAVADGWKVADDAQMRRAQQIARTVYREGSSFTPTLLIRAFYGSSDLDDHPACTDPSWFGQRVLRTAKSRIELEGL